MDKILHVQQEMNQRITSIIEDEWKKLEKEKEALEQEREFLKKEKEEWEALANKLNKVQITGNKIQLNIGGQIFATSLNNLTSQKGSFFEAMFSGRWETKPEDDGCYFIDRDPIVFRYVLNYLRGQFPTLDMLSTKELQLLKEDADFYQLSGLSDYLNSLPTPIPVAAPVKYRFISGPNYIVSSDGLEITKTSTLRHYDVTAITNPIPSSGIHHLKLKITLSHYANIMIGVCPSSINQSHIDNYKHYGWYFYCFNGLLFSGPPQCASYKIYYSASAVTTGSEVGVKMDMTNGQISFTVDGVDKGVAYKDIPVTQSLCFCIMLNDQNDCVRIIE